LKTQLVDADGIVKTGTEQLEGATITFKRNLELYNQEVGSKKAVDDSKAAFEVASQSLKGAENRRNELTKVLGEAKTGAVNAITLSSPLDGILSNIHASSGDTVPGNAPLFVVMQFDPVWLRVPVYVGDIAEIDAAAPAAISSLGGPPRKPLAMAQPVAAPLAANALASSIDIFFEMPNKAGTYRPGQRLGVALALKGDQDNLVVPWSALVHDIHGGSWVYEQLEPTKFIRRRVLLKHVQDDLAVLADGPAVGTMVVSDGAEELFGIEVGFAK